MSKSFRKKIIFLAFQDYSARLNLSSVNNSAGLQMKILLCFVWLKVFLVPENIYK